MTGKQSVFKIIADQRRPINSGFCFYFLFNRDETDLYAYIIEEEQK